ncbi:MAG TPA: cupin domain-containing protein [Pelobium sp.]
MKKFLVGLFLLGSLSSGFAQNNKQEVQIAKIAESTTSWNGDKLPAYPNGQPQITILKYSIPPHTVLPWHKHLVINAGVVTKGTLTVVDEKGNTLQLKAGESIVELINAFHYGENRGDEPVEIMVFYAGVEGADNTVKK